MSDIKSVCPECYGINGHHNTLHERYGNGAGGNKPCPNDTQAEQNELVERVILDSIKLLKDYGIDVHAESDGIDPLSRFAQHIIALVEADCARRLLADDLLDEMAKRAVPEVNVRNRIVEIEPDTMMKFALRHAGIQIGAGDE